MSLNVTVNQDLPGLDVESVDADDCRRADHVLLVRESMLCAHCGTTRKLALPIDMWTMSALLEKFESEHRECEAGEQGAACTMCFAFGHKENACPSLSYGQDLRKWFDGPDTGTSSKTIFRKLSGKQWRKGNYDYDATPLDPSDFGRCHRLLQSFTGWRERISEMADAPGWAGLVEAWDELEALYLEELPSGQCPKLYARMREIESKR